MMKPVRFAILGTGNIARTHAAALCAAARGSGKAELAAVWGRTPGRAAELAREFGGEAFERVDDLLARPDIEAVTIATPSGAHLEVIERAAAAGKHVLCEKPIEVTADRADRVIAACNTHGVRLACVFQARLNRHVQCIKDAIERGRFGRLVLASMQLRWFRDQAYYDAGGWRGTWALDGGGALMNQGIHFVDLLCHLAGEPEQVQAYTTARTHERIEVEDTAVATIRFAHGGLGTIEASTSCAPGFPRRLEISGEHGTAVLEDDRLTTWRFAEEEAGDEQIRRAGLEGDGLRGGAQDPTAIGCEGHRRLIEDLAGAIREDRPPAIPGGEARRAVALIEAIYEAARTGQPVRLAPAVPTEVLP